MCASQKNSQPLSLPELNDYFQGCVISTRKQDDFTFECVMIDNGAAKSHQDTQNKFYVVHTQTIYPKLGKTIGASEEFEKE